MVSKPVHPAPEPIENVQVWEKRASSNQEIIGLFYLTVHFTDAPLFRNNQDRRSEILNAHVIVHVLGWAETLSTSVATIYPSEGI